MNVLLWILQGVFAALFLTAGYLKTTTEREKLEESMPWVNDFSTRVVRLVGAAEILGAIGLVLPSAVDIAPWLTPLAASGLALIMVLASIHHGRKSEWKEATFNAVLFAGVLVIAIFRFGPNAF